ncbi:flagellar basal body P-ring protein FlgI [Amphibiibacter pelophylacis]|uniref:Flagellar basal body P-ring protein FlgI n=1 Tax=Amphibiibacter pelophylacis TaxID=1799477 RepID=A0ACC6P4K6_9BURK
MDSGFFRPHTARASAALLSLAMTLAALAPATALAQAQVRVKDVAQVQGVRMNQLVGYGLVVGLDGTGDQTQQAPFTAQGMSSMLQQLGVSLPPGITLQVKNVAAVLVTAQLPPFAQPGQPLDVTVSSIGNAKSLRGGTLIATPLKGLDGQVYAMAQGQLIVGGAGASAAGSKVQINHLSGGRIPAGATVERAVSSDFAANGQIQLDISSSDFATARAVESAINQAKGGGVAQAIDGRVVQVRVPLEPGRRIAFLADIENLPLRLAAPAAKVVINARTGSVVLNQSVTLGPAAVAHGNLSVTIDSTPQVSQPNALAGGQTTVTEKANIAVTQGGGSLISVPAGAKLSEVIKALNSLGATPMDLMAILQGLKEAGSLNAEIEVI